MDARADQVVGREDRASDEDAHGGDHGAPGSIPNTAIGSCLGLIRLAKLYPPERVEQACLRALELEAYNYKSVKSLLETRLEKMGPEMKQKIIPLHSNVRGRSYYGEADHD